jgi:hypothetical protein
MQEKTIHIPFNRTLFMASQRNLWELSAKKHYLSFTIYTVVALFCLLTGIKLETKGEFPICQILGGGLLFYMCMRWAGLFERRAMYLKIANKAGDRFEKETMDCTYIFNDDGVEYQDKEKLFRLKWHLFKPLSIVKDTILLTLREPVATMFTISRQELGDAGFNELVEVLKEKMGR